MKSKIYLLSFLIVFNSLVFTNFLNASEIPVIVIAPSKKAQSISTVGSSVVVLDEEFIENSNEFFLEICCLLIQLVLTFSKAVVLVPHQPYNFVDFQKDIPQFT